MHKLLVVMAQLELPKPGSRSQYTKSMLINLILLKYHKTKRDCVWLMMKNDPGVFNEDVGETFLSSLARCTNGKPNKHDIDYVQEQYWMIKTYRSVSDSVNRHWGHDLDETRRGEIKDDDPTVVAITAHLRRMLTQIERNKAEVYAPDNMNTEVAAREGLHYPEADEIVLYNEMDVKGELKKRLGAFKKQQVGAFFKKNAAAAQHWPLFEPASPAETETSATSSDSESDIDSGESVQDSSDSSGCSEIDSESVERLKMVAAGCENSSVNEASSDDEVLSSLLERAEKKKKTRLSEHESADDDDPTHNDVKASKSTVARRKLVRERWEMKTDESDADSTHAGPTGKRKTAGRLAGFPGYSEREPLCIPGISPISPEKKRRRRD